MELESIVPVMIYDNRCYLCAKFARIVDFFARGKLSIVGHYTDLGLKIKSKIFPDGYDSTNMFWFVDSKTAYGGRAALFPLLSFIFNSKSGSPIQFDAQTFCDASCKAPKAVFLRSKSLFTNSKKIKLK